MKSSDEGPDGTSDDIPRGRARVAVRLPPQRNPRRLPGEPNAEITARRDNGRRRPRGYADWRPQPRTRVLLAQVAEILAEYRDHLPLTVRQVFYRLVAAHGYEKTERGYQRLCEHLVRARRARMIPFEHIRDDGVITISMDWFGSPEDFWDDAGRRARQYRRDRQAGQPRRLELWCEGAGMAPQLARVADEFSVPGLLAPAGSRA